MSTPRSRLVVLSPEGRPADVEDVPGWLDPERFDFARLEDSGPPGTLRLEINGTEYVVSAEPAPALHPWHFEQPRWGEGEREAAVAARHAIALEAPLEKPAARSFREQLRVAAAMFGGSCPAVYDDAAARLVPGSHVRRLAGSSVWPGARELFSLHSVGPARGPSFWVHSHGLARAGVPELDLLGVPADDREAAGELLEGAASLLLTHGVPPTGSPFPVGEGLDLVLLPLADALARSPRSEPGGEDARDSEHREPGRLVLAPAEARAGGSPTVERLLRRVRHAVLFRSPEDTDRMRVLARERWSRFEELFRAHGGQAGWVFLAKLGYEPDRARERQEDVAREHLWFRVRAIGPSDLEATLESSPVDVAGMRKGETRSHSLERLTDWLVVTPDGGELGPGSP